MNELLALLGLVGTGTQVLLNKEGATIVVGLEPVITAHAANVQAAMVSVIESVLVQGCEASLCHLLASRYGAYLRDNPKETLCKTA